MIPDSLALPKWRFIPLATIWLAACDASPQNETLIPVDPPTAAVSTFTVQQSQNPSTSGNELKGVVDLGAGGAWAVGEIEVSTGTQTLVERFQDGGWRRVSSPNPGAPNQCGSGNVLNAVAGSAANDVWAVGFYYSCSLFKPLILHWNGTAWSSVASPVPSTTGNNQYNAVAVRASNDAWAVGTYEASNGAVTAFTSHWDGIRWTKVNAPGMVANNNTLNAVTILAANDVWAGGTYINNATGKFLTLLMHWNGSGWTTVSSPSPGNYFANVITGVGAAGPNDVYAAGYYDDNTGARETLVLHWNGTAWTQMTSANVSSGYGTTNLLNGLVVRSPTDIYAVGHFHNPDTQNMKRSLVIHYDGAAWSLVSSPSPGKAANLNAVASGLNGITSVGLTSPYGNDIYTGGFIVPRTLVIKQ